MTKNQWDHAMSKQSQVDSDLLVTRHYKGRIYPNHIHRKPQASYWQSVKLAKENKLIANVVIAVTLAIGWSESFQAHKLRSRLANSTYFFKIINNQLFDGVLAKTRSYPAAVSDALSLFFLFYLLKNTLYQASINNKFLLAHSQDQEGNLSFPCRNPRQV